MYSFQGQTYTSLHEVPQDILNAFIHHTSLTETIVFREGLPLFWEEHYLRLMASMRILRMEIPLSFTMEQLLSDMASLCLAQGTPKFTGKIKLLVAKTAVPSSEKAIPSTVYAIEAEKIGHPLNYKREQLPIDLYKDHYISAGLYASLETSYATWRNMAWTYIHENAYCDGILLNDKKQVVETLRGTLFLVNGHKITTPSLGMGNRKGVYRQQFLALLDQQDEFEIAEGEVSPFSLQKADELFVLGDAHGIFSIKQYRKKQFDDKITQLLWAKFSEQLLNNS